MLAATTAVWAKELQLHHQGLILNADIELAPGKTLTDGIILLTHGGLAHRDMEAMVHLRTLLRDHGYNTLAINLSLGINDRHGMYQCKTTHRHRHEDAAEEIGAWLTWLGNRGAESVVLLGHSRGGAQTALYAAEQTNRLVNAVILLAPATRDNSGAGYERRYQQPLAPVLTQARELVANGKEDVILEHANMMFCRDTSVSAGSFISYYGQDDRLDTPALIKHISIPVLVIIAGADDIVIKLEEKIHSTSSAGQVEISIIDGADHFFRDLYGDDAVDVIDDFLSGLGSLRKE